MIQNDNYNIKLHKMYNKAKELLESIGFKNITVKDIRINTRLKSTYGQYDNSNKIIEISEIHFLFDTYEQIMNTIIHEILHNIHDDKYTAHYHGGHTEEWIQLANKVTKLTGCRITQYVDKPYKGSENYKKQRKQIISKCKKQVIPKYRHKFVCQNPNCNYEFNIVSKYINPNDLKKKAKCFHCKIRNKSCTNKVPITNIKYIKTEFDHNEYKYR